MSVLRKMFGPSKEEIWRQLCDQTGGTYVARTFWKGDKVQASHGEWTVTLDVLSQVISTGKSTVIVHYTRLRAPYVNPDRFRFTIYRRGLFTDVAKWFGMQDVTVGHEPFDHDFVIKGTDETRLRALFDSAKLRELIIAQPKIHLTVKDNEGWFGAAFPENTDELYFLTGGVIKDVDRLKGLFDLFGEALEQLCRIGSAYAEAPKVKL
jgi:hypothetical protein